jgi:hypothetical protein
VLLGSRSSNQWPWQWVAAVAVVLPVRTALTLIGGSVGGVEEHSQPRETCPQPPTSLYSAGDRDPPAIKDRAPPTRTQSRGRDRAVGLGHGEINLAIVA